MIDVSGITPWGCLVAAVWGSLCIAALVFQYWNGFKTCQNCASWLLDSMMAHYLSTDCEWFRFTDCYRDVERCGAIWTRSC